MTQRWKEIDTYVKEWLKEAGQKIQQSFSKELLIQTKSNPNDLVTNMDKEIEQFFIARGTARAIANFNTAANLIPAVVALPLYPLIYKMNNAIRKNNRREKSFNVKSRSNI